MTKKRILAVALFATAFFTHGQNETDALRYAQSFFGGTARSVGMAGSFGALGADLSVAATNPGGLGRLTQNQTAISFVNNTATGSSLFNNTSSDFSGNAFRLANLGIVFVPKYKEGSKNWRNIQFGFTYNRIADFTANYSYEGQQYESLLEHFAAIGQGVPENDIYSWYPFQTALAYYTYALDFDPGTSSYIPRLTAGDMYHRRSIRTRGGIAEYGISLSGNFRDKLYVGGSLNFQNTRYFENFSHNEELLEPEGVSLRSFTYDWELTSKALGVNLKLGAIYAPIEQLRFGIAFHTPTTLRFNEIFSADMVSVHDSETYTIPTNLVPQGSFAYRFRNPMRLTGSVAYVFMRRGAINVDVEMARINRSEFRSSTDPLNQYNFVNENQVTLNTYRTTINLRVGAELALTPFLFGRIGFAFYDSPYDKSIDNYGGANLFYTAGLGYRWNKLFIDVAYRLHQSNMEYYAFDPTNPNNRVTMDLQKHAVFLTVGLRF
jgi:hypothetical protein